jgi:hypothetical protein
VIAGRIMPLSVRIQWLSLLVSLYWLIKIPIIINHSKILFNLQRIIKKGLLGSLYGIFFLGFFKFM